MEKTAPEHSESGNNQFETDYSYRHAEDVVFDSVDYLYINWSKLISSNWDVRIALAERSLKRVKPQIGLVMSHQHFKAFVEALNAQLQRLEESFGPIEYKASEDRTEGDEDDAT